MFRKIVALLLIAFCAYGQQQIRVGWDANTEADLAGYKVYQGVLSGAYSKVIDVRDTTAYATELSPDSAYYFAVTAYDTAGNESGFSNEVAWNLYQVEFDTLYVSNSRLYYRIKTTSPDAIDPEINVSLNGAFFGYYTDVENCIELPDLTDWSSITINVFAYNPTNGMPKIENTVVAPLSGDTNNDGKINVVDQHYFDKCYGSRSGWKNYRLEFDFDRDGDVDLRDIREFSKRYGRIKKND